MTLSVIILGTDLGCRPLKNYKIFNLIIKFISSEGLF